MDEEQKIMINQRISMILKVQKWIIQKMKIGIVKVEMILVMILKMD